MSERQKFPIVDRVLERKENQQYSIREATAEDADRIADIQYESWLETYPDPEIGITVEDVKRKQGDIAVKRRKWKKSLEQKEENRKTFVIRNENQIVGFCVASKGDHQNEIHALYLDPKEKGKGAGAEVFAYALVWLGDKEPAKLSVAEHNKKAIQFYERFGFHQEGAGHIYEMGEGKQMPLIDMIRQNEK